MGGASFEATLELWASSLRDVKARIPALFLDGLLGPGSHSPTSMPTNTAMARPAAGPAAC